MAFGYQVYFTERAKNRVLAWDPDQGTVSVVAGQGATGAAADQQLCDPYGLAVDGDGHLLIADKLGNRVVRLTNRLESLPMRGLTDPLTGNECLPVTPTGLGLEPDGSLLISQGESFGLYRRDPTGQLTLVAGQRPWERLVLGPCRATIPPEELHVQPLDQPVALLRRSDGTVLFIERGYQVVRAYHPDSGIRSIFPQALAMAFVNGEPLPEVMPIDAYHPVLPTGLAADRAGRWYLADAVHRRVWQVDEAAGILRCVVASTGTQTGGPAAISFGDDGTLWVLDYSEPGIRGYRPSDDGGRWQPIAATCHGLGTERLHCAGGEGAGLVCLARGAAR